MRKIALYLSAISERIERRFFWLSVCRNVAWCTGALGQVFPRSEKELYRRQKNSSRRESLQKPDVPLWVFVLHHHRRFISMVGKVSMTHMCYAGMRSKTIFRTPSFLVPQTSDVLFRMTHYISLLPLFLSNNKWSNRKYCGRMCMAGIPGHTGGHLLAGV